MAEINYPRPPEPQPGLMGGDPLRLLNALNQVNQLQKFQAEFGSKKAIGQAWQNALKPDGSVDMPKLTEGLRTDPAAAYGAPEAASAMLAQTGQQTANITALFDQRVKQNQFLMDGLGTLANLRSPTMEDVHNFVVTAARNTNIPTPMLNAWAAGLPKDPQGLKDALAKMQGMAIGSAGLSAPDITGFGPEGQPISGTRGQATFERLGVGAGAVPAGAAAVSPLMPPRAPGVLAPRPGMIEAQTKEAEAGQTAALTLQNAANEIPTQRTQLDLMRNDLKEAQNKFGPTAKYEKVANVVANRVLGFHPTMSKEEIAGLESFDKVARQIAMSQAGALHATDQTLHTALGANPNTELSAFGNEGIIHMLHGNADAIAVKAREWNKARRNGAGPDQFYRWSDQFNQGFDPRVFQFMRMTKDQQGALLRNIEDKQGFERNLLDADKRGWIKLPKEKQSALPGLRQAADGKQYVPDPNRPGKYLMLQEG